MSSQLICIIQNGMSLSCVNYLATSIPCIVLYSIYHISCHSTNYHILSVSFMCIMKSSNEFVPCVSRKCVFDK